MHEKLAAAMEQLEASIAALEQERARVLPQLAAAKGVNAEALAHGLRMLDDALRDAREKRETTMRRMARVERTTAITEELRRINEELAAIPPEDENANHTEQLRRKGAALRAEASELVAEARRERRQ